MTLQAQSKQQVFSRTESLLNLLAVAVELEVMPSAEQLPEEVPV
ncbi:hypothetical protein [Synechococcus sp. RS9916]|nr:hypothetical protein [Synechococcus sp. RS9916]